MNLKIRGKTTHCLDGDELRRGVCSDLGFSEEDRMENNRRAAEMARVMCDAGIYVVAALISPYELGRKRAEKIIGAHRFGLVHVATSLQACRFRDPKGLYAKAYSGEIVGFTGVDAPYDVPETPRWRVVGDGVTPGAIANKLVESVLPS